MPRLINVAAPPPVWVVGGGVVWKDIAIFRPHRHIHPHPHPPPAGEGTAIRRLKRWWQKRNESLIAPRLQEILYALDDAVPELEGVRAVKSGHRGHDSNFYLEKKGKRLAVLRLNNPHIRRPAPAATMPFILAAPDKRIAHELTAYTLGSTIQLTPTPIWHTHDALVCRFVALPPLSQLKHSCFWDVMRRVNHAIAAMHSLGLTHMDMTFNNILIDESRQYYVFIDFEYLPVPGLSIASQRAYDYLRLLEGQWKFVPESIRGDYMPWLTEIAEHLGADIRNVQFNRLAPALGRTLAAPGLGEAIRKQFAG